jgi:hypothetical protein
MSMNRVVLLAALVACGGAQKQAEREQQPFNCKDRIASYMAVKTMAGEERGVQIDCAEAGPRITRWKTDKDGTRQEDKRNITPGQFDAVWSQIAGTGWENLKDCTNGTLEKRDPVYQFDVADDENKSSFSCQTREVPYPYFDITNALDQAAMQGAKQLGDDEPADLKALDEKDKQR